MEMPKATDKKRRTSFIGNWNLSCGSEIQESKGSVWDYLHKINEEAPDLFPNPPSKNIRKYDGSMLVLCWTSDYRNEERVRRAAEFIRKRVHFPFPIHYFKLGSRDTLYLHTPEGEFYEHLQYGWSLVDRLFRKRSWTCTGDSRRTLKMQRIKDNVGLTFYMGNWSFNCGRGIQDSSESVWTSLHKINEEAPDLFSKPPTKSFNYYNGCTMIFCYTSDYRNEGQVKKAAEFLRKRVNYPFTIHYFSKPTNTVVTSIKHRNDIMLYLHTPEGEFYETVKHGLRPVGFGSWRNDFWSCTANSRNVSDGSHTMNEDHLPSQVLDTEYIYMPSSEEGIEVLKRRRCGKWMVFSESMVQHDAFWSALVSLYRDGTLVGLKASTPMISGAHKETYNRFRREETNVIHCYTADSENRDEVKKSATAIHKVLSSYNYIMYYKTNADSMDGMYYHEGCKKVTKYMLTVEGRFYERDEFKRWKPLI